MQFELRFTKVDFFIYTMIFITFYIIKEPTFEYILKIIGFCVLIRLSHWDIKYKAVPDHLLLLSYLLFTISSSIDVVKFLQNSFIIMGGIFIFNEFTTYYIRNIKSKFTKNKELESIETSLGEGDIPIFGIIGGLLGIELGILCILLSALISIIAFLFCKEKELPMIPFMVFSILITYFFQESIMLQIERFFY